MTVPTPPSTTLSTPSPTERADPIDLSEDTMSLRPIYLIVATSKSSSRLGIGFHNSLPWPAIRSDMAFFQKVTRDSRPPSTPTPDAINAVIMGRKTYESIPAKFRPLSGRLNVVISRTPPQGLSDKIQQDLRAEKQKPGAPGLDVKSHFLSAPEGGESSTLLLSTTQTSPAVAPILCLASLPSALSTLSSTALPTQLGKQIGNIFIIGGAEIYSSFLQQHSEGLQSPIRILQTEVRKVDGPEFECDTFFPLSLGEASDWKSVSDDSVREWVNSESGDGSQIQLPQGREEWARDDKVGVELRVLGWEKSPS